MSRIRHHLGDMIFTVLGSLFRKPATIHYPRDPFRMPDKFRGPPRWDSDRCVGCKLCVRDCPSGAITISRAEDDPAVLPEGAKKRFNQSVDLGRCVYCGQCAETCPRKVITMTSEFELAQIAKGNLKVTYHASPPVPVAAPAAPASEPAKSAGEPTA
jgi:formate hydrogenlyase subunit 6/NADH:ubiquinone oxidoreductase subunit I